MVRKGCSFCDQNCNLQLFYIKNGNFQRHFFKFNCSFYQNICHCDIPLGRGFSTISNLLNYFKISKSYRARIISALTKTSTYIILIPRYNKSTKEFIVYVAQMGLCIPSRLLEDECSYFCLFEHINTSLLDFLATASLYCLKR